VIQTLTLRSGINVNNIYFKASFIHTRSPSFEITQNGSLLGKTDKINTRFDYTVDSGAEPLKITAWIHYRTGRTESVNELGIEVNGKPVQHTTADPEVHIKPGRVWLFIFLPFLLLQSVLTYIYAIETLLSAEYAFRNLINLSEQIQDKLWDMTSKSADIARKDAMSV